MIAEMSTRYVSARGPSRLHSTCCRSAGATMAAGVSLKRRMVLACVVIAVVILVLTHTAPPAGLFDRAAGPRAAWHMPRTSPPTVYLTYDDGPNGSTTPKAPVERPIRSTLLLSCLTRSRHARIVHSSS